MYKLIIADDEPLMRAGLLHRNNWEEMGFEVVAVVEDGTDVLQTLKKQHVDVLLTDVCMYQTSGLELAKIVQEKYPKTKVVLISGFQDFEFARKAIRYGVYDYLLKPIDYDNLRAVFAKLKQEFDQAAYEVQLLRKFGEAEYNQVLETTRFVSDSVLGEGDESWVAYAHLKAVLSNAPGEVRGLIIKKLLELLKKKLLGKDRSLAEEFEQRLRSLERNNKNDSAESNEVLLLFRWLNDELISRNLVSVNTGSGDGCIQKACSYIKNHLRDDFTYRDVAEFVHLSPRHFIRRFRNEMGENFTDYVFKVRMEGAIRLLDEGNVMIDDIGQAVGYHDEKYFQTIFKKYTGFTLREYSRRIQGEKK